MPRGPEIPPLYLPSLPPVLFISPACRYTSPITARDLSVIIPVTDLRHHTNSSVAALSQHSASLTAAAPARPVDCCFVETRFPRSSPQHRTFVITLSPPYGRHPQTPTSCSHHPLQSNIEEPLQTLKHCQCPSSRAPRFSAIYSRTHYSHELISLSLYRARCSATVLDAHVTDHLISSRSPLL